MFCGFFFGRVRLLRVGIMFCGGGYGFLREEDLEGGDLLGFWVFLILFFRYRGGIRVNIFCVRFFLVVVGRLNRV